MTSRRIITSESNWKKFRSPDSWTWVSFLLYILSAANFPFFGKPSGLRPILYSFSIHVPDNNQLKAICPKIMFLREWLWWAQMGPWSWRKDFVAYVAASSSAMGDTLPEGGKKLWASQYTLYSKAWRMSHSGNLFFRTEILHKPQIMYYCHIYWKSFKHIF